MDTGAVFRQCPDNSTMFGLPCNSRAMQQVRAEAMPGIDVRPSVGFPSLHHFPIIFTPASQLPSFGAKFLLSGSKWLLLQWHPWAQQHQRTMGR